MIPNHISRLIYPLESRKRLFKMSKYTFRFITVYIVVITRDPNYISRLTWILLSNQFFCSKTCSYLFYNMGNKIIPFGITKKVWTVVKIDIVVYTLCKVLFCFCVGKWYNKIDINLIVQSIFLHKNLLLFC